MQLKLMPFISLLAAMLDQNVTPAVATATITKKPSSLQPDVSIKHDHNERFIQS